MCLGVQQGLGAFRGMVSYKAHLPFPHPQGQVIIPIL